MATFNTKQFVQTLTNMGFSVVVQNAVCEAYRAAIDTENGTFEMIITDGLIRASKPNGTERYWDNLTDARARSYVRQVLEFNKPVTAEVEVAEEVTEAEVEEITEVAEAKAEVAEAIKVEVTPKWQLEGLTVKDLRWIAKCYGLRGYSRLCKDELIDMIRDHQAQVAAAEAPEVAERTLTAESAEHLAYIDRRIADAEAELEAAEEEYADAETENCDAHSFPDCFDVDLSDQRLMEAERRLADAKEDLEAVRWERDDYLTDWAKYEGAPEATEQAPESDGNARILATDPEATFCVPEAMAMVETGDDARDFLHAVLGFDGTPFEGSQTGAEVSFTFVGDTDGLGYFVAYTVSERDDLGFVTVSGVRVGRAPEIDRDGGCDDPYETSDRVTSDLADGCGEPEFAPLTEEQEGMLEGLGVGRLVITEEQAAEVSEGLGLDRLAPGRLTPVRNSVVRHLSTLMSEAREAGDWDRFDQLGANLSGACAVIDRAMTRVA